MAMLLSQFRKHLLLPMHTGVVQNMRRKRATLTSGNAKATWCCGSFGAQTWAALGSSQTTLSFLPFLLTALFPVPSRMSLLSCAHSQTARLPTTHGTHLLLPGQPSMPYNGKQPRTMLCSIGSIQKALNWLPLLRSKKVRRSKKFYIKMYTFWFSCKFRNLATLSPNARNQNLF